MTKDKNNRNKEIKDNELSMESTDLDTALEDALSEEIEVPELYESYLKDDILYVPQEAKDKYASMGFDLQWIRIFAAGTTDVLDKANIHKKEQQGYVPLKKNEVPGLSKQMTSFFGDALNDDFGMYVIGDSALCKIDKKLVEARRIKNQEKTRARSRGVIEDIRRNQVAPNRAAGEEYTTTRDVPRTVSLQD